MVMLGTVFVSAFALEMYTHPRVSSIKAATNTLDSAFDTTTNKVWDAVNRGVCDLYPRATKHDI